MRVHAIRAQSLAVARWSRSRSCGGASAAADPSWPKEITFALLSTENAAEITRRWGRSSPSSRRTWASRSSR